MLQGSDTEVELAAAQGSAAGCVWGAADQGSMVSLLLAIDSKGSTAAGAALAFTGDDVPEIRS